MKTQRMVFPLKVCQLPTLPAKAGDIPALLVTLTDVEIQPQKALISAELYLVADNVSCRAHGGNTTHL